MEHTLLTGLTAELLPGPLCIDLDGCLTQETVEGLLFILSRGATLRGCPDLIVDLRRVGHLEASVLNRVEAFVDRHNLSGAEPSLHIRLPTASGEDSVPRRCSDPMAETEQGAGNMRDPQNTALFRVADLMTSIGPGIDILSYLSAGTGKRLCASSLRVDSTIPEVINHYREEGIRPLLVVRDSIPIGLVHPSAVRNWCQKQGGLRLEELLGTPAPSFAGPVDMAGVA